MGLKATALPSNKLLVALVGGGLHRIVNGEKANPLVHQLAERLKVASSQCWMATASITIDDHGISSIKNTNILWETVGHHRGRHKVRRAFFKALGQQHDAGTVFVGQRPVASRPGNHHDLLGFGYSAQHER